MGELTKFELLSKSDNLTKRDIVYVVAYATLNGSYDLNKFLGQLEKADDETKDLFVGQILAAAKDLINDNGLESGAELNYKSEDAVVKFVKSEGTRGKSELRQLLAGDTAVATFKQLVEVLGKEVKQDTAEKDLDAFVGHTITHADLRLVPAVVNEKNFKRLYDNIAWIQFSLTKLISGYSIQDTEESNSLRDELYQLIDGISAMGNEDYPPAEGAKQIYRMAEITRKLVSTSSGKAEFVPTSEGSKEWFGVWNAITRADLNYLEGANESTLKKYGFWLEYLIPMKLIKDGVIGSFEQFQVSEDKSDALNYVIDFALSVGDKSITNGSDLQDLATNLAELTKSTNITAASSIGEVSIFSDETTIELEMFIGSVILRNNRFVKLDEDGSTIGSLPGYGDLRDLVRSSVSERDFSLALTGALYEVVTDLDLVAGASDADKVKLIDEFLGAVAKELNLNYLGLEPSLNQVSSSVVGIKVVENLNLAEVNAANGVEEKLGYFYVSNSSVNLLMLEVGKSYYINLEGAKPNLNYLSSIASGLIASATVASGNSHGVLASDFSYYLQEVSRELIKKLN